MDSPKSHLVLVFIPQKRSCGRPYLKKKFGLDMIQVVDPLDDKVKARIVGRDRPDAGYLSSGSEHSVQNHADVESPCLTDSFFGFEIDDAGDSVPEGNGYEPEANGDPPMYDSNEAIVDLVRPILEDRDDEFRNVLAAHVLKATEVFSGVKSSKQGMRRNVMAFLRGYGYNAAICKTRWEKSAGITSGNYEFIDIVRNEQYSTRYFIDLDFASEFEIARPTSSYDRLLQCLPKVFVGKTEDLKPLLKIICDAAKRSLKSRCLHLPPWRKHRFMQKKWLGQYRRTTNLFPASFSSESPVNQSYPVKCRTVGFDAAVYGSGMLFPATARTR